MNYWLISDTHFNHERLTEWGGRSGDWQEQILNGLREIPANDALIHLGDFCIGKDAEMQLQFLEALKRPDADIDVRAILVRGNHDKKGLRWYTDVGWDFVCDGIELIYHGNYLHFTHRPSRPTPHAMCNIHGHTHGNMHRSEEYNDFYDPAYHLDISPELRGFKPLRLDTLLKKRG
jgi:calcineurin-like phosphoesterase family protein